MKIFEYLNSNSVNLISFVWSITQVHQLNKNNKEKESNHHKKKENS